MIPKKPALGLDPRVETGFGRALKDPEFARQISTIGIDPLGSTPDEFTALLRKEIPRWKEIVQYAGVKVEGDR